eukprot:gnl/TRDRNA2_/TRDRNA2_145789_c0_seq3.p2 gnl/TRDRNA2_/TRDRNA2_145789_c0~~gnl/TRDRNA2_/TRDRNA2_145789_c0_seq3.p2  ORF type:complete len:245 (-),score=63.47 gnl/TRDRNA2_/TRDRNA2_145789_c0_seq3:2015-2749(-)
MANANLMEPMLQDLLPRSARGAGKVTLAALPLVLFFTVLLSGSNLKVQEPTAAMMTGVRMQPTRPQQHIRQFTQPTRTSQFMQPARAVSDEDRQPAMPLPGRREAIASSLAAVAMMPSMASAASRPRGIANPEEALEQQLAEKKAAEEAKAKKKAAKEASGVTQADEDQQRLQPILYTAAGGVALSVPLYFANLQRLATKVASGGKDDGYGPKKTVAPQRQSSRVTVVGRGKKAPPANKGGFFR